MPARSFERYEVILFMAENVQQIQILTKIVHYLTLRFSPTKNEFVQEGVNHCVPNWGTYLVTLSGKKSRGLI